MHKKTSPRICTSMHSGGFELTKLSYARLEDNLIRHRGDRYSYYYSTADACSSESGRTSPCYLKIKKYASAMRSTTTELLIETEPIYAAGTHIILMGNNLNGYILSSCTRPPSNKTGTHQSPKIFLRTAGHKMIIYADTQTLWSLFQLYWFA